MNYNLAQIFITPVKEALNVLYSFPLLLVRLHWDRGISTFPPYGQSINIHNNDVLIINFTLSDPRSEKVIEKAHDT